MGEIWFFYIDVLGHQCNCFIELIFALTYNSYGGKNDFIFDRGDLMFTAHGSLPLHWKVILPIFIAMFLFYLIASIVKIGKTKVLEINEIYHITPPRFELFRPFIMAWLYLLICFLLPNIIMAYYMGILILALIAIMGFYAKTWIRSGYSIFSYVILNIFVLVISIFTSMLGKILLSHIISYIGRFYNVI